MDTDPIEHLIEECSESYLAIRKAKRWGWNNANPSREDYTNLQHVLDKCRDVECQIARFRLRIITVDRC